MAGTMITEANLRETLTGTEQIPFADSDEPKGKLTPKQLKAYIEPDMTGYVKSNEVLKKDNTEEYTPSGDYNPATKKYVDSAIGEPTATASSLEAGSEPTAAVTVSGDGTAKVFAFTFGIPQGKKGDDGKTPVIEIGTVATFSAGSSATATLTENGTDDSGNPKYLLNLGIPKGDKGDDASYTNATQSSSGLMSAADKIVVDYYNGYNSVTSLASIPVDKRLVVATVSADGTVSLADTMTDGRELHIIINNSGSSSITVTLPDSSTLDIEGGSFGEVNIIYAGGTQYIRSI